MCKSVAMGVSRLTGMNSEAIRAKTHKVIANTPLQYAGCSPSVDASMGWAVGVSIT